MLTEHPIHSRPWKTPLSASSFLLLNGQSFSHLRGHVSSPGGLVQVHILSLGQSLRLCTSNKPQELEGVGGLTEGPPFLN